MKFHPVADIFPMLPEQELLMLSEDIKANGLKQPIWTSDEMILDGRNRYRACKIARVDPAFKEFKGGDPLAFVLSLNLHRRHLNESQRAGVAAKIANIGLGEAHRPNKVGKFADLTSPVSQPKAAEMLNVGERIVRSYKAVERDAPELTKRIDAGEITVHEAQKEVRKSEQAKRIETIKKHSGGKIESVNVICGDILKVAKEIKDNSIDLLLTDPPYLVMGDYEWDKKDLSFWREWMKKIKPKLKDKHTGFIFCDARMQYQVHPIVAEFFDVKRTLVWIRKNMSMGRVVSDNFISSYEVVFYFGTRPLNFPPDWGAERFDSFEYAVPQSNFAEGKFHPTQKPLELFKRLVSVGSHTGDVVLDPFCGSGTTGLACQHERRSCILVDENSEYCDIARGRMSNGIQ
jgi:hypothetical protein